GFRAFGFKVGFDLLRSSKIPILVRRVDSVCPGHTGFSVGQALCLVDAVREASSFVKGVEADMLDKADAIDLYLVHLSAKLHGFYFFSPDNRTQIGFMQADNTVRRLNAFMKQSVLLTISF